jgi:hypothetical protein
MISPRFLVSLALSGVFLGACSHGSFSSSSFRGKNSDLASLQKKAAQAGLTDVRKWPIFQGENPGKVSPAVVQFLSRAVDVYVLVSKNPEKFSHGEDHLLAELIPTTLISTESPLRRDGERFDTYSLTTGKIVFDPSHFSQHDENTQKIEELRSYLSVKDVQNASASCDALKALLPTEN